MTPKRRGDILDIINERPEGLPTPNEMWAKLTRPSDYDNLEKLQEIGAKVLAEVLAK